MATMEIRLTLAPDMNARFQGSFRDTKLDSGKCERKYYAHNQAREEFVHLGSQQNLNLLLLDHPSSLTSPRAKILATYCKTSVADSSL